MSGFTPEDVTDQAIYDLQSEADSAGDRDLSAVCQRALEGDRAAREECTALIRSTDEGNDQ